MAYFRITPETLITITPGKFQYEIGENMSVDVAFSVDAKDIVGTGIIWTIYCEVYIFGKMFKSGGDQKFWPAQKTATTNLRVALGKATTIGTFDGYVAPKAKVGY